jgi:hypothetical protein
MHMLYINLYLTIKQNLWLQSTPDFSWWDSKHPEPSDIQILQYCISRTKVLNQHHVTQNTATSLFYTNAHSQSQLQGNTHNYLLQFSYKTVTRNVMHKISLIHPTLSLPCGSCTYGIVLCTLHHVAYWLLIKVMQTDVRGLSKKYPTLGRGKKVLYLGGYNT